MTTAVAPYSGAGGLDLGFAQEGVDVVQAVDVDPLAIETHSRLLAGRADVGDVSRISWTVFEGVDLVIGGPPCQGFSVAGKMDPADPRSRHVFEFLRVVEVVKPRAFVMENVKALAANRRQTGVIEALRRTAEDLGYHQELLVLDASDYGVPQARERMFFVGLRDGLVLTAPKPVDGPLRTVRDALATLPPWGQPGNGTLCTAKIVPAKKPVLRRSPYAGMLFNGQGRPLDLDRPALTLPASMGGNRTPIIDQAALTGTAEPWVVEYHASLLRGDAPATVAPDRLRRITVEEAAALQTFPVGLQWAGPTSAQFRQIGNAVPPLLAAAVARSVLDALEGP